MILALLLFTTQTSETPPAPAPDPAPSSASPSATSSAQTLTAPRTLGSIDQQRFDSCHDTATDDPARGIVDANEWLIQGGGFIARQCLGFAFSKNGNFAAAASTFAQAAHEAETARDWRVANLWAQAGNAALASGDAASARQHLNAALVQGRLTGLQLGQAYLDRARAALVLQDWASARADLDAAARDAAQDPLVWLLSATLARRQNDLVRAQADIQQAVAIAPRDAAIALEAGNIAAAGQRLDAARTSWQSAVTLGEDSDIASTAQDRLAQLTAFEAAETAATAPPP
jgi:tetratricopeptide (TPR) repeat protein